MSDCVTLFSAHRRPTLEIEVQKENSQSREVSDYIFKAVLSTGATIDAKIEATHYVSITNK